MDRIYDIDKIYFGSIYEIDSKKKKKGYNIFNISETDGVLHAFEKKDHNYRNLETSTIYQEPFGLFYGKGFVCDLIPIIEFLKEEEIKPKLTMTDISNTLKFARENDNIKRKDKVNYKK